MRAKLALAFLAALALGLPASAPGKGFMRVVLVSADGRSVDVRGSEAEIDGLLSRRGALDRIRGGYLRLFFVGRGDFPANRARFYPGPSCVALDWPTYETSCRAIDPQVARLLRPGSTLARFRVRPTVLVRVAYTLSGSEFAAALSGSLELALDRRGRGAPQPRGCYPLTGSWRGPRAASRPRRFLLCPTGVYAAGRLHPLRRGVWAWFRLNVGPPPAARRVADPRPATYTRSGLTVSLPRQWRVVERRLTPCTNPIERLTASGRGALVMLQESLPPLRRLDGFSPRPRRFVLRGEPQPLACCAPTGRAGWFFDFRERGRAFYVYVYLGKPGTQAEALALLDSVQVRPRRES